MKDANFRKDDESAMTQGEINLYLNAASANFITVESLPTENIQEDKIYLVSKENGIDGNAYEEYKGFNSINSDYTFSDEYNIGSIVYYEGTAIGIITSVYGTSATIMSMAAPNSSGGLWTVADNTSNASRTSYSNAVNWSASYKAAGLSWHLSSWEEISTAYNNRGILASALTANGGTTLNLGETYYWCIYNNANAAIATNGTLQSKYSTNTTCCFRAFATITTYEKVIKWEKFGPARISELLNDANYVTANDADMEIFKILDSIPTD